jgi:hypothetical protein
MGAGLKAPAPPFFVQIGSEAMMDVGSGHRDAQASVLSPDLAFAIILVTYGARLHLVGQAVRQALLHPSVKSVIIVDNDSAFRPAG